MQSLPTLEVWTRCSPLLLKHIDYEALTAIKQDKKAIAQLYELYAFQEEKAEKDAKEKKQRGGGGQSGQSDSEESDSEPKQDESTARPKFSKMLKVLNELLCPTDEEMLELDQVH